MYPFGSGWPCAADRWDPPCGTRGSRPAAAHTAEYIRLVSATPIALCAVETFRLARRHFPIPRALKAMGTQGSDIAHPTRIAGAGIAMSRASKLRSHSPSSTATVPVMMIALSTRRMRSALAPNGSPFYTTSRTRVAEQPCARPVT